MSELKAELMRLVGSTKKAQKIDNAPGMAVRETSLGVITADALCFIPRGGGLRENRAESLEVFSSRPNGVSTQFSGTFSFPVTPCLLCFCRCYGHRGMAWISTGDSSVSTPRLRKKTGLEGRYRPAREETVAAAATAAAGEHAAAEARYTRSFRRGLL